MLKRSPAFTFPINDSQRVQSSIHKTTETDDVELAFKHGLSTPFRFEGLNLHVQTSVVQWLFPAKNMRLFTRGPAVHTTMNQADS